MVLLTYTLQGGDTALSAGFSDRAMCFAAEHGLAAFRVSIAKNDGNETGGTKSAAAALSWINDNGDLFGANTRKIVLVGFGAAASNLSALLVHDGYSMKDDYIAGLVMLSGVFSTTSSFRIATRYGGNFWPSAFRSSSGGRKTILPI